MSLSQSESPSRHGGDSEGESGLSTSPDGERPVEYDVSKLLDLHVDLKQLSQEDKYRLLKTKPNNNLLTLAHIHTLLVHFVSFSLRGEAASPAAL